MDGHRDTDSQAHFFGHAKKSPAHEQAKHYHERRHAQDHSAEHDAGLRRRSTATPSKPSSEATLLKALVGYYWASRALSLIAIQQGRIAVNDVVTRIPNALVNRADDLITVDGEVLRRKAIRPVTIVFHKPRHISSSRESGKRTLYSFIPNRRSWLTPAGLLPQSANGIVVASNDKRFRNAVNTIAHLTQDVRIKVQGVVSHSVVTTIAGNVHISSHNSRSTWLTFKDTPYTLHTIAVNLKNHGLEVLSWERSRLGPFTTADLAPGAWYQLTANNLASLDYMVEHNLPQQTALDEVWQLIENQL